MLVVEFAIVVMGKIPRDIYTQEIQLDRPEFYMVIRDIF